MVPFGGIGTGERSGSIPGADARHGSPAFFKGRGDIMFKRILAVTILATATATAVVGCGNSATPVPTFAPTIAPVPSESAAPSAAPSESAPASAAPSAS